MPKTLLFEVGFSGLSRNMFGTKIPELSGIVADVLKSKRIEFSKVRVWFTEKRIGVLVDAVSSEQQDDIKEIRGPKISAAYDLNNMPTPAATGFAKAQNTELKDLYVKEIEGVKFLCAPRTTVGVPIKKILPEVITDLMLNIFANQQKWKLNSSMSQPAISFCAMIGSEVPDIEFEGMKPTANVLVSTGFDYELMPIVDASDYPMIMKKMGVLLDIFERLKVVESRIMSTMPMDLRFRKHDNLFAINTFFAENPDPLFLEFDKKYLELPEALIEAVLSDYFGYMACEDSVGKIMNGAVCLPFSRTDLTIEQEMRQKYLTLQLEGALKMWERDCSLDLTEEFKKCSAHEEVNDTIRNARRIANRLGYEVDEKLLTDVFVWIKLGENLSISSIAQRASNSAIVKLLESKEDYKEIVEVISQIDSFIRKGTVINECRLSKIITLSLLMKKLTGPYGKDDCCISQIVEFLKSKDISVDIFRCLSEIYSGYKPDRKRWLRIIIEHTNDRKTAEQIVKLINPSVGVDPNSLIKAINKWEIDEMPDFEMWTDLYSRLKNKIQDISESVTAIPDVPLEIEIGEKLLALEMIPGIDYIVISDFFNEKRVDLEAFIMNLPPVLDDVDESMAPKIALTQRIIAQLARLPFKRKEKKQKRIEYEKKADIL